MESLDGLLRKLPTFAESRMVAAGFAVWMAWKTELNPSVSQTLADYGGVLIAQERRQSLWFFLNTDVFLALARLEVWVRLNPIPVFAQVVPAKLLLGLKLEMSISVESKLAAQNAYITDDFKVYVHPKAAEAAKGIPGVILKEIKPLSGMAVFAWRVLGADPRLPYESGQGWRMVLKPVGNPLDKAFQAGWREFFPELEAIFKSMKLQFLMHDFFVMFTLENLRALRRFCKEFLSLVDRIKREEPARYWPCVLAAIDKKGVNFTIDLPKKVPLDWEQLTPDFPHFRYRTAFLLGDGFKINDVRFSVDHNSVDDWCNVALSGEVGEDTGAIAVELPKRLVAGEFQPCFYCGLRNHQPPQCPSRNLTEVDFEVWDRIAAINLTDLSAALTDLDLKLAQNPLETLAKLLHTETDRQATIVKAVFEIGAPTQPRFAQAVFRSIGKEYPKALKQLGPKQGDQLWEAFATFLEGDLPLTERSLNNLALKAPRNYQVRTLQGFLHVEKGDLAKAQTLFQEAENLSITPLQQALNQYLQARCLEMLGKPQNAGQIYRQIPQNAPRLLDALYRQGVCLVKMGFAEQAMGQFNELIGRDPHLFNRMLFDPELERGHLHLLQALHGTWIIAKTKAEEETAALVEVKREIGKWFTEDHPFFEQMTDNIAQLGKLAEIDNYVAFETVVARRAQITRKLALKIEEEGKKLRKRFDAVKERLKSVRAEAGWFPFPRILVDFNRDYNFCARILNWVYKQPLQVAENFKKAFEMADKAEDKVQNLESRLKTLKIVRDSTLFLLILGKGFFWLELVALLVVLLLLPLGIYYGQQMGQDWASGLVARQKWEIQKGLVIIFSIMALGLSALRTALVFEKKKNKLLAEMEKQPPKSNKPTAGSPLGRRPKPRSGRRPEPRRGK